MFLLCSQDRLDALARKQTMPRGKAKRFVAESTKDDFAARQLVDTGCAARQAMAMLKRRETAAIRSRPSGAAKKAPHRLARAVAR